jgi:hypothetical protein
MTCTDVRKLLPGLALGDLDAEPGADVSSHLAACAGCRQESGVLGRTLSMLRAAPSLPPSTERRTAAVAAMARAHAEQSERLLVRRPRPWLPWATAAAFLLALGTALLVRGNGPAFQVAQLKGRAELRDPESGRWRPVAAGMRISVGDRLLTCPGSRVRLGSGSTELVLDEETSIEILAPSRVTLDRGRLLALAPASGAEALLVTDSFNNSVRATGRVELSLRDVTGQVLGWMEERGKTPVPPDAKTQIERSLVARVQFGEAALDGVRDQRLRASGGQEGRFNFGGQPATVSMAGASVGEWAESGFEGR